MAARVQTSPFCFFQCKQSQQASFSFSHQRGLVPTYKLGNKALLQCIFHRDQKSVCSSDCTFLVKHKPKNYLDFQKPLPQNRLFRSYTCIFLFSSYTCMTTPFFSFTSQYISLHSICPCFETFFLVNVCIFLHFYYEF